MKCITFRKLTKSNSLQRYTTLLIPKGKTLNSTAAEIEATATRHISTYSKFSTLRKFVNLRLPMLAAHTTHWAKFRTEIHIYIISFGPIAYLTVICD